jgi:hypothetical protein
MKDALLLLLQSRKFLLMLLDVVISLALYFVSKYAVVALEDIKYIILALQPVVISLILAIAHEDAALASQTIIYNEPEPLADPKQG